MDPEEQQIIELFTSLSHRLSNIPQGPPPYSPVEIKAWVEGMDEETFTKLMVFTLFTTAA